MACVECNNNDALFSCKIDNNWHESVFIFIYNNSQFSSAIIIVFYLKVIQFDGSNLFCGESENLIHIAAYAAIETRDFIYIYIVTITTDIYYIFYIILPEMSIKYAMIVDIIMLQPQNLEECSSGSTARPVRRSVRGFAKKCMKFIHLFISFSYH